MKPADQIVTTKGLGDCFRASVASIFEFPIHDMPNFWEKTQDAHEYWILTSHWIGENLRHRCLTVQLSRGTEYQISGVLCVAMGTTARGGEDHAVVWLDGLLHDPHPSKTGIDNKPDTFTVFIPIYDGPPEAE